MTEETVESMESRRAELSERAETEAAALSAALAELTELDKEYRVQAKPKSLRPYRDLLSDWLAARLYPYQGHRPDPFAFPRDKTLAEADGLADAGNSQRGAEHG